MQNLLLKPNWANIDDYKKMQSDPKYAAEVRMDPGAFVPKKDRQGKAKEEETFETWADNVEKIGEDAKIKPYVSMYFLIELILAVY